MKILITGAEGFVGLGLCKLIAKQDNCELIMFVSINTSPEIVDYLKNLGVVVKVDIATMTGEEIDFVRQADYIFHLAARKNIKKSYSDFYTSNVIGTSKIVDMLAKTRGKMIFLSTYYVYPQSSEILREYSRICPRDAYSLCKAISEQEIERRLQERYIIFRACHISGVNSYGKVSDDVLSLMVSSLLQKRQMALDNIALDFLDVRRAVTAIHRVGLSDFAGTINLGSGRCYGLTLLNQSLKKYIYTNAPMENSEYKVENHTPGWKLNISLLRNLLNLPGDWANIGEIILSLLEYHKKYSGGNK